MKKPTLLILLLAIYGQNFAQIETDRPDFTESPNIVQIETGFVWEKDFVFNQSPFGKYSREYNNFTYNSTLFRYGLSEKIELRANIQYNSLQFVELKNLTGFLDAEFIGDSVVEGINTSFIGFKTNLFKNERMSIGFLGHLYIPDLATGDFTRSVGQRVAPEFLIPATVNLTEKWGISGQFGMTWDGFSHNPTYNYNIGLGFGISDKFGTYLEAVSFFSPNQEVIFLNGGFTYLVSENFQLDLTGGYGLTDDALEYFLSTGLSYRILKK